MESNLTTRITITMPEGLSIEQCQAYLKDHWDDFREALDLTGDYYDRKSQVDKISVESIELTETQVVVHYTVEYSGFHACHDIRYAEKANRKTIGLRSANQITFEKFQQFERRSTCDEF